MSQDLAADGIAKRVERVHSSVTSMLPSRHQSLELRRISNTQAVADELDGAGQYFACPGVVIPKIEAVLTGWMVHDVDERVLLKGTRYKQINRPVHLLRVEPRACDEHRGHSPRVLKQCV